MLIAGLTINSTVYSNRTKSMQSNVPQLVLEQTSYYCLKRIINFIGLFDFRLFIP